MFSNKPTHLSGNSGPFIVLADYIRKRDAGAIAAILPLVTATNASSRDIRQFLGRNYHVETIIASHDPERIYFSENTSIGEILIICRKRSDSSQRKPPTRIVNLAVNPSTPAEAVSAAHAIMNDSLDGIGVVQEWDASRIAAGDWGAVQFLSPYLCEKFIELRDGGLFRSAKLGGIAEVGPAGQRIRDAYRRSELPNADGRVALWQHDSEVTQTIASKPDTNISAKPEKAHLADRYWQQRSTLLLPTRLFLPTTRVISPRLNIPAVGSAWCPCRIDAPPSQLMTIEKAVCVYLNSSLGILAILGDRSNRKPTYPNLSLDDLRKLTVPDFAKIGDEASVKLAAAYDTLAEKTLLPLPQMDSDPIRRELDNAVCAALRVDEEVAATIRAQLAAEPSVTGRRYRVG